mmetsp:Transcript_41736/g.120585  ORF Transcript_41736/g.120585 Transcript_41736/m.120585 type:complete len:263 (-) Transcript_41736:288-1076(-)
MLQHLLPVRGQGDRERACGKCGSDELLLPVPQAFQGTKDQHRARPRPRHGLDQPRLQKDPSAQLRARLDAHVVHDGGDDKETVRVRAERDGVIDHRPPNAQPVRQRSVGEYVLHDVVAVGVRAEPCGVEQHFVHEVADEGPREMLDQALHDAAPVLVPRNLERGCGANLLDHELQRLVRHLRDAFLQDVVGMRTPHSLNDVSAQFVSQRDALGLGGLRAPQRLLDPTATTRVLRQQPHAPADADRASYLQPVLCIGPAVRLR